MNRRRAKKRTTVKSGELSPAGDSSAPTPTKPRGLPRPAQQKTSREQRKRRQSVDGAEENSSKPAFVTRRMALAMAEKECLHKLKRKQLYPSKIIFDTTELSDHLASGPDDEVYVYEPTCAFHGQ